MSLCNILYFLDTLSSGDETPVHYTSLCFFVTWANGWASALGVCFFTEEMKAGSEFPEALLAVLLVLLKLLPDEGVSPLR